MIFSDYLQKFYLGEKQFEKVLRQAHISAWQQQE
jgi:hypothetical protein